MGLESQVTKLHEKPVEHTHRHTYIYIYIYTYIYTYINI